MLVAAAVVPMNKTIPLSAVSDGLLSVKDAAAFLGLPRTTVYHLLREEGLPSLKVGRRRLIPRRGLIEFLASRLDSRDE